MHEVKDTKQATVKIGYDGRIHKTFHGPMARERCENEIRILKLLEAKGCEFVPKLLDSDAKGFYIVTSHCGTSVERLSQGKMKSLYAELEQFGVRHEDKHKRNVTYNAHQGRFCLIDFELATTLPDGVGLCYDGKKVVSTEESSRG